MNDIAEPAAPVRAAAGGAPRHTLIVGGGLLGLHLAQRLRAEGQRVTVLEAASHAGGLADHQDLAGHRWDRFYHVILKSDLATLRLLRELGLESEVCWGVTRTGFFADGALHSMSNSVEFLRFPALSLIDKFRLGFTIFAASRIRDWRPLESTLAVDWLRRWSGQRVLDRIWLPLLKSKLGDNYRIASAAFIWAIIARMYAARRSGLKREEFGYLKGGYAPMIGALAQRLQTAGVELQLGVRVRTLTQLGAGVRVETDDGRVFEGDHVVLTLPTTAIAQICPQLQEIERARLQSVVYQGIACASLLLREPLSPYYVTNLIDPGLPFTGVIEMTALVDRANFGGASLVYLPVYLAQDDSRWQLDDAALREPLLAGLERMYPHFKRDQVIEMRIARARQVLAVTNLDYSSVSMPPVATSLERVSILNSAQIPNGTLNVNETLGVVDAQFAPLLQRVRA